ncbi:hypothetical protein [Serratia fonticola]|uniref:hypothetical protein n=1 Tax=Serratia fonticola TaxID=47917 RepID=UPI0016497841|nr:hypothetical protein [Serratia fonticola]MBC3229581.1 hypothetical protein [Serratia fonticola]
MDIYYVESPGQIVNAAESIYARRRDYKIIIRYNNSNYNDSQIKSVIDFYIKNTCLLDASVIYSFTTEFGFFKIISSVFLNVKSPQIFIGCHKSKYTKLLKALRVNLTLMDDGIATLVHLKEVGKDNLISRILNRNYIFPLYTFLSVSDGRSMTYNDFSLMKSLFEKRKTTDVVFFGAKYVEIGLIEKNNYLTLLTSVLDFFKGDHVTYIPHREESDENLKEYSMLGYSIKRLSNPSEIALVKNEICPHKVAGFYSASILTSILIDGSIDAYSFKIPDYYIDQDVSNRLSDIYKYFEKYVHVVDIAKI